MQTFSVAYLLWLSFCRRRNLRQSDLIQRSLIKVWKGYHLKEAGIQKPKIEDIAEVLQRAETTDKATTAETFRRRW